MAITTIAKKSINRVLRHVNARIDSTTVERLEERRLRQAAESGHFDREVFPLPNSFQVMQCQSILDDVASYADRFRHFDVTPPDARSFSFANEYFTSPDAEVLYALIRRFRPSTFIEVGSGNSTRLARQAIADCNCGTRLISIDPEPRADIAGIVDVQLRSPVESLDPQWLAGQLSDGDILLIDSSHTLKACGDVAFLYLRLLPLLPPGVLIHIHDIFIPYDYPREWVVENGWPWNEQYLVHALLNFSDEFEVMWAGYHLQRSLPEFGRYFPRLQGRRASSLWLRRRQNAPTGDRNSGRDP